MGPLYYFAYGSNLHPTRLRQRAPSARICGRAHLRGYSLRLHKRGRDQSAKCDASWTGRRQDVVHGVLYRIARGDLHHIDKAEDLGRGYDRVRIWVSLGGKRRSVLTYLARPETIAQDLRPLDWYLRYVLSGGRHHGLPGRYLLRLSRHDRLRDPKATRRRLNRQVKRRGAPPWRRR